MNTRSAKKQHLQSENMLDNDSKKYFEQLIQPLAKSAEINELRAIIDAQNDRIRVLEEQLGEKNNRIDALESEMIRVSHNMDVLHRKCDDVEQYTRRYSVRINGIAPVKKGEREDVMKTVESCFSSVGVPFKRKQIDRAHRVGRPSTHPTTKKKSQQIIVKFKSWEARCAFYQARPKFNSSTPRSFTTSLDLTARRLELSNLARDLIKDHPHADYVYTDINCRLTVRMKDNSMRAFNSKEELDKILGMTGGDESGAIVAE